MRMNYANIDQALLLSLYVKAMNDIIEPKDLVLLDLVFVEFPKIYTNSETPKVSDTLGETYSACTRVQVIMARMLFSHDR